MDIGAGSFCHPAKSKMILARFCEGENGDETRRAVHTNGADAFQIAAAANRSRKRSGLVAPCELDE
jgi:hypothetical protein